MTLAPLVSIITPSYNQGEFLEQTICSVLEQDYPNIEHIVIDGGSTDNSIEILKHYHDNLSYWVSEPDHGQAQAINKGFIRANGSILGWLNADDILLKTTVSKVIKTFTHNPDVDVVYGHIDRIDDQGRLVPTPILPKDKIEFGLNHVIGECVVNQPGSFWRKHIMEKTGMLDESLNYGLDYEFWIRLALKGAKFKRLHDTLALFRLSASSKTVGNTGEMAIEQLQILDRLLSTDNLPEKLGLPTKKIVSQTRRARSAISLHAFYGSLKKRNLRSGGQWLWKALKNDPGVLFKRRWLDLAYASLLRRFRGRSSVVL